MADPQLDTSLEGALANQPVLGPYLGMKQYLARQQRDEQTQALQQQFLQERQSLGPNASPQDLINLATRYATPTDLLHYQQASQDRKEATAARLQTAHELAQNRIDTLQQRRDEGIARVKTAEDKLALDTWYKGEIAKHQKFQEETNAELKKLGIGIQQQRADTYQQSVDQAGHKNDEPLLNMLDKIDATTRMIQSNPEAVGGRGMLGRGMEFVGGMVNPGAPTPASDLQSQILDLQTTYRGLPGHAASRLKIDAANVDNLIKGLGTFTAPDQALNSLKVLRDAISRQVERRGGDTSTPEAPQSTGPKRVTSEAEYNALPSGSSYIAPDGSTRKKR